MRIEKINLEKKSIWYNNYDNYYYIIIIDIYRCDNYYYFQLTLNRNDPIFDIKLILYYTCDFSLK